jgi:Protein of unknown function (DUF4230)
MNRPRTNRSTLAFAIIALLAAVWFGYQHYVVDRPDAQTVVAVSLRGLQEQQRLVPFTARYVAVVTSAETKLGLKAQKTLILPGTVRYELDLGLLTQQSLEWDAGTQTLSITLPPLEIAGPEFALSDAREYSDGAILLSLTDAETRLDAANGAAAKAQLLKQAREPVPMKLAQDASIKAVENAFALPLDAVGVEAKVVAQFEEE